MREKAIKMNDLDVKQGLLDLTISTFTDIDSDGDLMKSVAFTKTIKERGPGGSNQIKHLKQHDISKVIGMPKEFINDGKQLRVITQMAIGNSDADDAMAIYKVDGFEHSIGFETIKEEYDEAMQANIIGEVKLWEYSSVTWGANDNTPFNGAAELSKAKAQLNKLNSVIRKANISDKKGEELELQIKLIELRINEATKALNKNEPQNSTQTDKPLNAKLFDSLLKEFQTTKN